DPKQMLERGDLFRGVIEDKYVGAFLEDGVAASAALPRADLIATAIEVLRVAALSSYENRAISSGVLLLDADDDPVRPHPPSEDSYQSPQSLTAIKSFYRLCDGLKTLFLVNRSGVVLDIIEVARYAGDGGLTIPCPQPYRAHALATSGSRNLCVV